MSLKKLPLIACVSYLATGIRGTSSPNQTGVVIKPIFGQGFGQLMEVAGSISDDLGDPGSEERSAFLTVSPSQKSAHPEHHRILVEGFTTAVVKELHQFAKQDKKIVHLYGFESFRGTGMPTGKGDKVFKYIPSGTGWHVVQVFIVVHCEE